MVCCDYLMQDFTPRIFLSDSDFIAMTKNGALCNAKGQLGPKEFEILMREQILNYTQSRMSAASEFWSVSDQDFTELGTLKQILMEQLSFKREQEQTRQDLKDILSHLENGQSQKLKENQDLSQNCEVQIQHPVHGMTQTFSEQVEKKIECLKFDIMNILKSMQDDAGRPGIAMPCSVTVCCVHEGSRDFKVDFSTGFDPTSSLLCPEFDPIPALNGLVAGMDCKGEKELVGIKHRTEEVIGRSPKQWFNAKNLISSSNVRCSFSDTRSLHQTDTSSPLTKREGNTLDSNHFNGYQYGNYDETTSTSESKSESGSRSKRKDSEVSCAHLPSGRVELEWIKSYDHDTNSPLLSVVSNGCNSSDGHKADWDHGQASGVSDIAQPFLQLRINPCVVNEDSEAIVSPGMALTDSDTHCPSQISQPGSPTLVLGKNLNPGDESDVTREKSSLLEIICESKIAVHFDYNLTRQEPASANECMMCSGSDWQEHA
jgi:hypothetical protein